MSDPRLSKRLNIEVLESTIVSQEKKIQELEKRLRSAVSTQDERVRNLEEKIINLGGNPYE